MATPKAEAPPATAVMVVERPGAPAIYNLDDFPETTFNRLIPTQTIRIPTDLLVPVVQIVQLERADRDGKSPDHYKSNDVPAGYRAPTARALNKFATAAGVSFYDERRMDDGSDPNIIGVTVMASMLLPTGQRITAPGSQLINLRTWFGTSTSDAEKAKFRKQFYAHVSTRARNRAIRGLLSLRSSYPDAEISKPFAVVSYAPNMDHPAVRERMLDSVAPRAVSALYGPEAKQLAGGEPVISVPEIPADELAEPPTAQVSDEPSWFDGAATAAVPAEHRLVTALRAKAETSGLAGAATDPQKAQLQAILRPLGLAAVTAVLGHVFSLGALNEITAAQAQAVIELSRDNEFPLLWGELAEQIGAAAAA